MSLPKRTTVIPPALIALFLFTMSSTSCTFYKTTAFQPSSHILDSLSSVKEVTTIYNQQANEEYTIADMQIQNDTVSGELRPIANGKRHDLHDKSFRKMKEKVFDPKVTMHIFTLLESLSPGQIYIPIGLLGMVEVHKYNAGPSITTSTLIVLGVAAVAGGIYVAIECSCPDVVTVHGNEEITHGSMFPGAIFKSLKRKDFVTLDLPEIDEKESLTIHIKNKQGEKQFLDKLAVHEVNHEPFTQLGLTNSGELVAWNESTPYALKSAESEGRDISERLQARDGEYYRFDDLAPKKDFSSVILTFSRPDSPNNVLLTLTAKQSGWLDTVGNVILHKAGKAHEDWVKRSDNKNPAKLKKRSVKRGLAMNAYLLKHDKWEYQSTFYSSGTSFRRQLAMHMDISDIDQSEVIIKLECAFKIWEIDHVDLSSDWDQSLEVSDLEIIAAVDQDGKTIMREIAEEDEIYQIHSEDGDYAKLTSSPPSNRNSTIVVEGIGYYHHQTLYEHPADIGFIKSMRKKDGLQKLSIAMDEYLSNYNLSHAAVK